MFKEINGKLEGANSELSLILGTARYEELESAVNGITSDVRTQEEIEKDILALCGSSDVSRFITAKETIAESYISEYVSINDLKAKAFDLDTELKKINGSISAASDIPSEFIGISDPEAYLRTLQADLKNKRELREDALTAKTAAASRLESYKENINGDPVDEAERAERTFEEQKALLGHWMHIREVFESLKENLHNDPMRDVADRFTHYLGIISNGKVSSEFPEADKLNVNVYSDSRLLDYGKLSEGTKETVSLAFRLAVLDHLFPNGGGVIVFDDPFTDMDSERAANSCRIIKEAADRHQVIFLTCREEYLDMLDGNNIMF